MEIHTLTIDGNKTLWGKNTDVKNVGNNENEKKK